MNQIKLQNLTPDIYYSASRDFQFIGRLFDVVLNSVKTNSENMYNLPLNDFTDDQLIDLMTMTLGFKSRHNYNVKQLTALCSAFATIIKNKGNIESINMAVRALLNAEGITETPGVSLSENNAVLNLFIPQALTDTNLLKDLLNYILPAGMSCNIIRELQETFPAATELGTTDTITPYINVNTMGWKIVDGQPAKDIENTKAIVPQIEAETVESLSKGLAQDTAGLLANTDIYRPDDTNTNDEEN